MSKIMIAVPCMDQVPAPFAQSLAMIRKPDDDVACSFQMGSLIYTSRNNLALQAMRAEFDYMLWLDSDMVFQQDLLEGFCYCYICLLNFKLTFSGFEYLRL